MTTEHLLNFACLGIPQEHLAAADAPSSLHPPFVLRPVEQHASAFVFDEGLVVERVVVDPAVEAGADPAWGHVDRSPVEAARGFVPRDSPLAARTVGAEEPGVIRLLFRLVRREPD